MFQSTKQKRVSIVVFAIYLVLLAWLVLFKFSVSLSDLPQIRHINLIPFAEPVIVNGEVNISEIIYNMIVFIPLGVYVSIFRDKWSFCARILPALCLSLLFEAVQYAFGIGASDITDVIMNTLGGVLGLLLFMLLRRLFKKKTVTAVNIAGIAIELCGIGFIVLLTVANM